MMNTISLTELMLKRNCGECALHPLCLPASVGIAEVEKLSDATLQRRPLQRGDVLYRTGDPQRAFFSSQMGAFKTVSLNESGDEQVIGFFMPGELIGLDGLANGKFRCDAIALESARVCEIPLPALERVAAQKPVLQHQMLKAVGEGFARHQDHLKMLSRKHAQERLAMFLHGLCEREAHLGRRSDVLKLPMSRLDIASYLSLVIETVSRELSKLQEEGVIAVKGRQVQILQAARLAAIAHGDGQTPDPIRRRA